MMSIPNEEFDKMAQLELLPVELQCRILTSIPNMKTLHALLSASPRFFQVYKTCPEVVLSEVGWNHITPAVVPIALKALEEREDRPSTSQKTLIKGPREIPLKTWKSLLRFHRIVDSLITNFTSSRLVALENSLHPHKHKQTALSPELPGRNLNLSQLEYGRLARAFYHLELYSYIKAYTKYEQLMASWAYMLNLRDWEVEEVFCVRSYLIERLLDFLNKFEEDFMNAYLKDKARIVWKKEEEEEEEEEEEDLNWRYELFVDDDHQFPWYKNQNYGAKNWIESSIAHGLRYLSAVFSADKLPDKFNVLDHVNRYYHWMRYALDNEEEVTAKIERPSDDEDGFYNDIEQPNEAWFWASQSKNKDQRRGSDFACDTNDFQRWAYVIWDHARLERLGILTKSPSDIQAMIGTDWLIKRTPKSLETRTREQEKIWAQEGLQSTLTEPRPVFDWETLWFK